jgi:Tat protein translocase TatB subunit
VGSIGLPEILVVLVIALIVLGPSRLPEAARSLGKAVSEFRRVTSGLQAEVRDTFGDLDFRNGPTPMSPDGHTEAAPSAPPALPSDPAHHDGISFT